MLGHRHQPFFEQRQPMLHPCQAPPVTHRLIERIAGRRRPEGLAIAPAKPLDRLFIQQSFGRGQQGEAFDTPARPLIGGIKTPHRLDLVPEEIEPQGLFLASGEQIDYAPRMANSPRSCTVSVRT